MGENGRLAWRTHRAGRRVGKGGLTFLKAFRVLLIIGGVLGLAGISLVASSFGSSTSSTTSIPAGSIWYMYYEFNVLGPGNLRGDYQETTGGALDLYVLTEAQYQSYRAGTNIGSLWSLGSSNAGTIDVVLPGSGKYFLVADHGTSYESVRQVVHFSLHLAGVNPTTFAAGIGLLGTGMVVAALGVLKRKMFAIRAGGHVPLTNAPSTDPPSSNRPDPPQPPMTP